MNSRIPKILVIVVSITAAPFCHAGFYKCVDGNGKVAYSDVPCPQNTGQTEPTIKKDTGTNTGPSVTDQYKAAARIYSDMNRERKEENDSAQRYNKESMESLARQQKNQNEHENYERTRKRYYGR